MSNLDAFIGFYFDYLEELRQSGEVNMFGAGPYLQKEFGLSRKEAQSVLKEWMERHPETTKGELL